ncbi:tetratricopeptide repeat protein [Desulfococcus sp.]|uniref:tetratricopeptide repeat protein n=1 Tax=Desulfococcus sp. TaxID=2025834 RepID=UPI00359352DC
MSISSEKHEEPNAAGGHDGKAGILEDEFLQLADLVTVKKDAAKKAAKGALAELDVMIRDKRWEDAVELFHPLEDKIPEAAGSGLEGSVRQKIAFALGQIKRFDDAIQELEICIQKDAENFYLHNSLAYTAYNSLYAAKNREIFLSGKNRQERIDLAHRHFTAAQAIRPDGVTNFYRQGMLYRQIQNKDRDALPLFLKAIANWEGLAPEEREARHQERKNYVKSLYQGASAVLESGRPQKALDLLKRCLAEDNGSEYISMTFKYFALGKVHFNMCRFIEARDALLFSLKCNSSGPVDFVRELLGRTYLALGNPAKGLQEIERIPEKIRRPYVRWTESDLRISLEDFAGARTALINCTERDNRSRHKTLVRLARLEYLLGSYREVMGYGKKACEFFAEKWGLVYAEGLYWQALGAYRLGLTDDARSLVNQLETEHPNYPELNKLKKHLS